MRLIKFRGKVEGKWWYVTPDDETWSQFWARVDRNTISQFVIGPNQYVSQEIYEGDIIDEVGDLELVRWDEGDAAFHLYAIQQGFRRVPIAEIDIHTRVVGNIYDDPDLLDKLLGKDGRWWEI
jgi:hypothetical protein